MEIDRQEFISALKRLKYLDWHVSDLFDRLDRDRSGQLSVEEFSAFLEKAKAQKNPKKKDDGDIISQFQVDNPSADALLMFQEKFETGAYSLIFNTKLQKIGTRSGHTADLIRAGTITDGGGNVSKSSMTGSSTIGHWATDDTGGFAQKFERGMDYCEEVRRRLKHKEREVSDLKINGHHTYGVS